MVTGRTHAIGGEFRKHGFRRSEELQFTGREDGNSINMGHHFFDIVGGKQDGMPSRVKLDNLKKNLLGTGVIQVGKRLVQYQGFGVESQDSCNGQTFSLASGEPEAGFMCQILKLGELKGALNASLDLLPGQPEVLRPEGDIFPHRLPQDLAVGILEHHPHSRDDLAGMVGYLHAV